MCDDVVVFEFKRIHKWGWAMGVENQPADHEASLTTCLGRGVSLCSHELQELFQVMSHSQSSAGPITSLHY